LRDSTDINPWRLSSRPGIAVSSAAMERRCQEPEKTDRIEKTPLRTPLDDPFAAATPPKKAVFTGAVNAALYHS
jgi:hypothetical protein